MSRVGTCNLGCTEVVGIASAGMFALFASEEVALACWFDCRLAIGVVHRALYDVTRFVNDGGVVALLVGDIIHRPLVSIEIAALKSRMLQPAVGEYVWGGFAHNRWWLNFIGFHKVTIIFH